MNRVRSDSENVQPSGVAIFAFAFVLLCASVVRFPIIETTTLYKAATLGAQFASAIAVSVFVWRIRMARQMTYAAVCLVGLRIIYGIVTANIHFGQDMILSFQEARFGIFVCSAPLFFYFFSRTEASRLTRFVVIYVSLISAIDIAVAAYVLTTSSALLTLAHRTSARFFISGVPALVGLAFLLIRARCEGRRPQLLVVLLGFVLLLHSAIITTSRAETLLSGGIVLFGACAMLRPARFIMYFLAILGALSFAVVQVERGGSRDYTVSATLADEFPVAGVGYARDTLLRSALGLERNFYISDYGLITYILRYGLLGFLTACVLAILWLRHFVVWLSLPGSILFDGAILTYVVFVPFLDYSSLQGAMMLAYLAFVRPSRSLVSRQNVVDGDML